MKKLLLLLIAFVMFLNITTVNAQKNIDCDGAPFLPDNSWKAEPGPKVGFLKFDPATVEIQKFGFHKSDWEIIPKKLNGSELNGCVLGYLLDHQNLIPVEWKDKRILFWGTTYTEPGGAKCVLCLIYFNDEWTWEAQYLSEDGYPNSYAIFKK